MNLYQLKTAVTQRGHKVKDIGTNIIPCNTTLYKIIPRRVMQRINLQEHLV